MKITTRLISVVALALGLATPALAQEETPHVEASVGYSYVRHPAARLNLNGGSASVSFNFNRWLGVVADIGGYHGSETTSETTSSASTTFSFHNSLDLTRVTYVFGPRMSYPSGRLTPFVQVLFGGAHESDTEESIATITSGGTSSILASPPFHFSQNSFAMIAGGGLDLKIARRIAIRVAELDYLQTQFFGLAQNQLRVTTGIVFHLGSR